MASIVENITGNKALQLGNEEFVRKMTWGNNWNWLRIGCRASLNGSATLSTIRLQLGVANGDTDTWSSSNCAGYVAACCGAITNTGGTTLTWDGTNYRYSGPGVNDSGATSKLGSTVSDTQGGTNGTLRYIASSAGGSNPSILMADIVRVGGGTYTCYWRTVTSTQLAQLPTFYDFLRCMEDNSLSSYAPTYIGGASGMNRTTVDNLDTLSVYWNYSTPTIEIADLCVVRFN